MVIRGELVGPYVDRGAQSDDLHSLSHPSTKIFANHSGLRALGKIFGILIVCADLRQECLNSESAMTL
jgi:hypothetical protein